MGLSLEEKLRELNVYDIDIEDVIEICKEAYEKGIKEAIEICEDYKTYDLIHIKRKLQQKLEN